MRRFASQCPDVSPNRAQSVQCQRSWDVLQTSFRCTRARPLRRQVTDRLRLLTIYGWGADRQCPLPSPVFNRLDAEVPQAPRASPAPIRHCTPCWMLPGPPPAVTARIVIAVASRLLLSAQRPAHPETLISQGPIAKRLPRLPKGVRSSETP